MCSPAARLLQVHMLGQLALAAMPSCVNAAGDVMPIRSSMPTDQKATFGLHRSSQLSAPPGSRPQMPQRVPRTAPPPAAEPAAAAQPAGDAAAASETAGAAADAGGAATAVSAEAEKAAMQRETAAAGGLGAFGQGMAEVRATSCGAYPMCRKSMPVLTMAQCWSTFHVAMQSREPFSFHGNAASSRRTTRASERGRKYTGASL